MSVFISIPPCDGVEEFAEPLIFKFYLCQDSRLGDFITARIVQVLLIDLSVNFHPCDSTPFYVHLDPTCVASFPGNIHEHRSYPTQASLPVQCSACDMNMVVVNSGRVSLLMSCILCGFWDWLSVQFGEDENLSGGKNFDHWVLNSTTPFIVL